jgi:hypothetical protein
LHIWLLNARVVSKQDFIQPLGIHNWSVPFTCLLIFRTFQPVT